MTYIFGKWLKRLNYVGNDLDLWEMAQICKLFDKRLKKMQYDRDLGNGLDPWVTA